MMRGLGVHSSLWTGEWTRAGAEHAVAEAKRWNIDLIEIALLDPPAIDADHTRTLLEGAGIRAACSLGLPEPAWASVRPDAAIAFLTVALDRTKALGGYALCGVTFGGIGERTGKPPTQGELDNVARVLEAAARHAKSLGLQLGIEAINRYENHLINTGAQAAAMLDRVGADNTFVHLDTYHMNIEEKGMVNGIMAAGDRLAYVHVSESDRGVPGAGTCDWDGLFGGLAATGFKGALVLESFVNLPPQIASALSVWRPVAKDADEVMRDGWPFVVNKARQYGLA